MKKHLFIKLSLLLLLVIWNSHAWGYAYLKGSWDSWTNHDISGGSCEITLSADTEYEFGIDVDGSFYSMNNTNIKTTTTSYQIYTGNSNCKITTKEAGVYIFKTWYDNGRFFAVYYPEARLTKNTYFYFDARNSDASHWNSLNPIAARFYFKYYDNGNDHSNSTVNTPLETSVLYTTVPNHDYIGQVQINRMSSDKSTQYSDKTNLMVAYSRDNTKQNCLVIPAGQASAWSPTVQWTTYCPPKATSTISNNGTTTYGGSGTSESPLLVEKGTAIKVSASSTNTLDDGNRSTKYHFYDNTTSKSGEQAGSTYQFDASSSADVTYQMRVNSYNQYNSTNSSDKYSDKLYFKTVTCYTVSYSGNSNGSGTAPSTTKHASGSNVTLNNNSGSLAKDNYSFNGWNTANDGSGTHYAGGGTLSGIAANTSLYAEWLQTITIDKNEGGSAGSMSICFNATTLKSFTAATRDGYSLAGYFTESSGGTKIVTAAGTLVSNISGYTDNTGKWTRTSSTKLYAQWKQTYSVTYVANYPGNATSTGGSVPTDDNEYGAGEPAGTTVTVLGNSGLLAAGGYTFDGWQTEAGGGTHYAAGATFTISANTSLYAKWEDVKTTVSLAASPTNSGTFTVGGDAATSVSAGLATNPTITAVPATGFYVNESATVWSTEDSNITIDDDDNDETSISADGSGGTATLTATFSPQFVLRGSTVASDVTTAGMAGWSATDNSSYSSFTYADGVYTIVAALTSQGTAYKLRICDVTTDTYHGCASSGQYIPDNTQWTLDGESGGYDVHFTTTVTGNYTFKIDVTGTHPKVKIIFPEEPTYRVTIANSNISGSNIWPQGSVSLKPVTTTSINATVPQGFRFGGWTVDSDHSAYVTIASASSTSTTVTAVEGAAGATITATYSQAGFIYFDDSNSDWGKGGNANVYVYFFNSNNGWYDTYNDSDKKGAGLVPANAVGGGAMTRIGYTNIYYFDYQSASITPTGYVGFTKGNCYNFYQVQDRSAAWRTDFNSSCYPMYVASSSYTTTNRTGYHSTGYWKNYNVTNSGVWLYGSWDTDNDGVTLSDTDDAIEFTAVESNSNIFKAEVTLSDNTYEFYLLRSCKSEYLKNNGTITTSVKNWEFTTGASNCHISAPTPGKYIFTLVMNDDHIRLNVDFPLQQNDYRLLHYDGYLKTTEGANHPHPSQHVSHLTIANTTVRDTISFFIDKDHKGSIKLQKCTNPAANSGKGTWADSTYSASPVSIDISGITKTGIYNFEIVQTTDEDGARTVSINRLNNGGAGYEYDGKLYIRTNIADGGWDDYKSTKDNELVYSDYSKTYGYDYYHMHWAPTSTNVKFCIANDYSPCITDSLTGDTWTGGSETLSNDANVRFMYNSEQNTISRAYISGSSNITDRFLVLEGDAKMFDEDGNALSGEHQYHRVNDDGTTTWLGVNNQVVFDDNHNWIYESTVKAKPGARVKLTAKYGSLIQYFYGGAGSSAEDSVSLLGGTGDDKYRMRVVYDFKTNRLIKAFVPTDTVTSALAIGADLMIIREHQGNAQQIIFKGDGSKLTEVQTVYGAMKFNKWTLNDKSKEDGHANLSPSLSRYERDLFWISFPFEVKLSDVFGFGEYGKHWIIEYYDGKGRAEHGFWADSDPNWKFVMPAQRGSFTMNAYEGYILALDLEELTTSSTIWDNNVEDVYIYFPSNGNVGNISATSKTVTFTDQNAYKCIINRPTPDGNRTIKDSYWHCIGVPSFADDTHKTNTNWTIDAGEDGDAVDSGDYPSIDDWTDFSTETWSTNDLPYLYEWQASDNTLIPVTTGSYKFKTMYSYLVQYNVDTMKWMQVNVTPPPSVAARLAETPDREYKLVLQGEERTEDQTFVRLTDETAVSNRFEFNYDLSKEYNAGRGNIWTVTADTVEVAGNSMPKPVQTTVVPVGVKVVANGEYTLSMPEGTNGENVVLIDNAYGTRTNLGLMPYTVTLTAGTYEGRFALEFGPIQDAPTGIDEMSTVNSQLSTEEVRKVFVGGRLYIIRDGKVYDVAGQRVE